MLDTMLEPKLHQPTVLLLVKTGAYADVNSKVAACSLQLSPAPLVLLLR